METRKSTNDQIAESLRRIRDDQGDELVFDPQTGTLQVRRPGEAAIQNPDAVSATEMAREGFFASRARVS